VSGSVADVAMDFALAFANYLAANIDGFYFINNEGRWELRDGIGLCSTQDLIETYLQEIK